MTFPKMILIHRNFETNASVPIEETVSSELKRMDISAKCRSGESVAITVGSRGIADIASVVKSLAKGLSKAGLEPFIVPAMGSHGGATPEGQQAVVESLGVTEAFTGFPIRSSMDVVEIGRTPEALPIYVDRHAWNADHIVVVGRIKPHTDYSGKIESGLFKMMAVGLGNQVGALASHQAFTSLGFEKTLRTKGQAILDSGKILLGLALVETQKHETSLIKAIAPEAFATEEESLFSLAERLMPNLPFQDIDLLVEFVDLDG